MFALSYSVLKTRAVEYVQPILLMALSKSYRSALLFLAGVTGISSAFINNTPIVATLIPMIGTSSRKLEISPSRFLLPMSYLAILGGSCTLIGTSTNLLVSGLAHDQGLRGFNMFTLTPIGLIFFASGLAYLLLMGRRIIPERLSSDEFKEQEGAEEFTAEATVQQKSVGKKIEQVFSEKKIDVKKLKREEKQIDKPRLNRKLQKDDILVVTGPLEKIRELVSKKDIQLSALAQNKSFPEEPTHLLEIVLLPNSSLVGEKLRENNFLRDTRARIIGIRQRGNKKFHELENIKLKAGDILVLLTNESGYQMLKDRNNQKHRAYFFLQVDEIKPVNQKEVLTVLGVIATVIVLASMGWMDISIASILGIIVLSISGILNMDDVYRSIDWKVIFLLAGSLSLGKAMESSGLSEQLAQAILNMGQWIGTTSVIIACFYLATSVLTEIISNNASVALMVPVAISVSTGLGIDEMPLLVAVAMAGSASFVTPIGYQTNTMVYSAGAYQFMDFARAGIPLNILFLLLASLLIPWIYPA
ncbi:MAG TPA: SLC13 family permease, partial [Saprospiraceae bacterium]|nr:SLC13 family permease [Saprospiraceae bacterium]